MSDLFGRILFLGVIMGLMISGSLNGQGKSTSFSSLAPALKFSSSEIRPSFGSFLFQEDASSSDAGQGKGEALVFEAIPSPVFIRQSPEPLPEPRARAALIADLETGEVYFVHNPELKWHLASITKLMTAAFALREMDLSRSVTFAAEDFREDGSVLPKQFAAGEAYRAQDVIEGMLLLSSNEAAEALARVYGRAGFIAGMNRLGREWGTTANFHDPTGLSPANQATALDLLAIASKIYSLHPRVFAITTLRESHITELHSGKSRTIANIDLLASRLDFLGGKTGYTDESGGNLLSIFAEGGRPIFVVVLGTNDRFGETENLLDWFTRNFRLNR